MSGDGIRGRSREDMPGRDGANLDTAITPISAAVGGTLEDEEFEEDVASETVDRRTRCSRPSFRAVVELVAVEGRCCRR